MKLTIDGKNMFGCVNRTTLTIPNYGMVPYDILFIYFHIYKYIQTKLQTVKKFVEALIRCR